jgi:hypothetical protein
MPLTEIKLCAEFYSNIIEAFAISCVIFEGFIALVDVDWTGCAMKWSRPENAVTFEATGRLLLACHSLMSFVKMLYAAQCLRKSRARRDCVGI